MNTIVFIMFLWFFLGIPFGVKYVDDAEKNGKLFRLFAISGPLFWILGIVFTLDKIFKLSKIPDKIDNYFKTPSIKK
jgi:Na+/proline symporter